MTHDARMGWIGLSAFVAEEHAGRAPVVTKPAVRFTAEEQAKRRALDVPAPFAYALVHVDVDVSSFEDKTRAFRIGDRVRVVNRGDGWKGAEGVLTGMLHHFHVGDFTQPGADWRGKCAFIPSELELIEPAKPAEAQWIEWKDGLIQPCDDVLVDIRCADDSTHRRERASNCYWGFGTTIVAYRVVS